MCPNSTGLIAIPPTFDLQSHSHHSDGALAPREVVAAAVAAGVELLALSDHDTVDGVPEARAAAGELGAHLVSAVEISAFDDNGTDHHILGYLIDDRDPRLAERLEAYRTDRRRRAAAMAQALSELGFELDEDLLHRRAAEGKSIGRPHLAQAVLAAPANASRLDAEGLMDSSAFLEAYLIEGRPGFRPRTSPSVRESIAAVHEVGGLSVWAHPFWAGAGREEVLQGMDRMHAQGIDGIECFSPMHGADQVRLLSERCQQLGLLSTGSSDF
ncbi:MAG: PHP domain-containing protein, partial [Solirubrobacterales bacterium]|nr:PHP domain-containing protein [Solirubrobacterales bacterium]